MKKTKHPRPQFYRDKWQNLNGVWEFAFDDLNVGHKEKYMEKHDFPLEIYVPFCFQADNSGIGDETFHDHIWYRRYVKLIDTDHKGKVYLHIGASDYLTELYVNHTYVGSHEGGHTAFSFDVTEYLNYEEEEIVIYVKDESKNQSLPRGKQYWKLNPESIWYPRTTGIWQTVWLEFVPNTFIESFKITPIYDEKQVEFDLKTINFVGEIEIEISSKGDIVHNQRFNEEKFVIALDIDLDSQSWSPEHPYLFDVKLRLIQGNEVFDCVDSYFGMRKIHYEKDKFYLNNKEYFQKLILDQGYYPGSLLTSKSDDDLINDILLSKEMGFNGCRKHQKVEEDRFLYHADKLGYIVWAEMANAYAFSKKYTQRMKKEWTEAVNQQYNHPSIVAWVPLNESWGIRSVSKSKPQQNHQLEMYELTKSLDQTRLVSSNDGWEQMKTDICAIHNYMHGSIDDPKKMKFFKETLRTKDSIIKNKSTHRPIYVKGYSHCNEPIILTEFGGISFNGESNGWGYTSVNDKETFIKEYERLIIDIKSSECIVGFCYTQLTDVYQETNGLLNFDRTKKIDLKKIKKINDLI